MDPEKEKWPTVEEETAVVDGWTDQLSETGEVGDLDRGLLRRVLEAHGANLEIGESERNSLGRYSNKGKASGMRAVWGERFQGYKKWTKEYIDEYEAQAGKKLPALAKSGRKNSGMLQFLGELTAYAALVDETFPMSQLRVRTAARVFNGRVREQGNVAKEARFHIMVKSYNLIEDKDGRKRELPFAPAGFPPEFPKAAWEYLKS